MKNLLSSLILFLAVVTFSYAQTAPVNDNGLAIGGYDVVAYFTGSPTQGIPNYSAKHDGITYHFSSQTNLEAFQKAPGEYLPQFDGYCAWGVGAMDEKFPINPETFDIIDGKLYLFFNGPFNGEAFNSLLPWGTETSQLLKQAHDKWPTVKES